jgi:oligoribonuclease NrnB/cAMP/cGMP phosphodiesterase (DHH superfamily)
MLDIIIERIFMQELNEIIENAKAYLAPENVEVIIYHHPCPDGALGAFSSWLKRGEKDITYLRYMRENLKDGLPLYDDALLYDKHVLFIDCAPSISELKSIRNNAKKVMILDHHISAANELDGQEGCYFLTKNSGAVLAWHYFHGLHEKLPLLYELVQDRDLLLWHKKDQSVALDTAIAHYNPNFDFAFFLPYLDESILQNLINDGQSIIDRDISEVNRLVTIAESRSYKCLATNKTYNIKCVSLEDYSLTLQVSEILRLQEDVDFCMTWYPEGNNIYRVSMRTSKDKTDVDLSIISKYFGGENQISGGGHANKAGCRVLGGSVHKTVSKLS